MIEVTTVILFFSDKSSSYEEEQQVKDDAKVKWNPVPSADLVTATGPMESSQQFLTSF